MRHTHFGLRLLLWLGLLALLLVILIQGSKGDFVLPLFQTVPTTTVMDETYDLRSLDTVAVDTAALRVQVRRAPDERLRVIYESNLPQGSRAQVSAERQGDTLVVREHPRLRIGLFFNVFEQVTVLLPRAFTGALDVRMTSGALDMPDDLDVARFALHMSSGSAALASLRCAEYTISSSSGSIRAGAITGSGTLQQTSGSTHIAALDGESHSVRTTSGSMRIDALRGRADVQTTSGLTQVDRFEGAGSFSSTSGAQRVEVTRLTGDISFRASSGSVRVTLPRDAAFRFAGRSGSGSIHTDFPAVRDGKALSAAVGDHPVVAIDCQTSSGSVRFLY
ncbi:MAG: DUF4097 domain-containing protein [Oscillospiraceae bacterium]|jgi:hypothetical protein|nr:DUF4097 domain-containing protein [Oscillospiraceae bacterium]